MSNSWPRWFLLFLLSVLPVQAQRYVIADQDAAGPGGSDMTSLLVLLQSPGVKVLGITVVTGDGWRDPEVDHALRMLEIIGRTDIGVYAGALGPLVRTREWTALTGQVYGLPTYLGAWSSKPGDDLIPEGRPVTRAAGENAAHFMIRMVHQYPHQVTIYAGGPLTNVALAVSLDEHFAELAQQLIVMGGSINPQTDDAEWYSDPRHEFNFWFDPEAASIVLRANWPRISVTTIDASLKTRLEPEVLDGLSGSKAAAAQYVTKYTHRPVTINYLWDELAAAAWLDPAIITRERFLYMDVNTNHGAGYGDTLTYTDQTRPKITLQKVHAQMDVDLPRLQHLLIHLLTSETPNSTSPSR